MRGDTLDVNDLPAPATCPRCFDTGTRHEWRGDGTYADTGEPCGEGCELVPVPDGPPCLYCGRPSATRSRRTGHPLCRTDARMEANEDEADRRMARGDRWVTTLGIGGDQ